MMTGTMTTLMWLMMSLMLLGSAVRGITWARRRRGGGLSASPSARQAAGPAAADRPLVIIGPWQAFRARTRRPA